MLDINILCWSRSFKSKEPRRGYGEESSPAAPMAVVKSAPTFMPAARPVMRLGMVRSLPLRLMKPWFANALRPGHGLLAISFLQTARYETVTHDLTEPGAGA